MYKKAARTKSSMAKPQFPITPNLKPKGVNGEFINARITWSIAPPKKRPDRNKAIFRQSMKSSYNTVAQAKAI